MSKNEENNSHLIVKNNSIQNLNMKNHNKNKSSNFLTDSPSTLISVQLHSINSNKNSKNKENEVNINNKSLEIVKDNTKNENKENEANINNKSLEILTEVIQPKVVEYCKLCHFPVEYCKYTHKLILKPIGEEDKEEKKDEEKKEAEKNRK